MGITGKRIEEQVERRAPLNWNARLDALVARPLPLFVGIFLLFVIVFGASIALLPRRYGQLIIGDGVYYYAYLRAAVIDHSLDFSKDYDFYIRLNKLDPNKKDAVLGFGQTPTGKIGNLFSVGPAVLWLPIYLPTHLAALALHHSQDGFSYFYEAPILFLSIFYGFLAILMIWRVAADLFSRWAALVAALGIWLATNVVYYMGVSPSASHVLSLFAVSLFIYWWHRTRAQRTWRDWFVWGLCGGLMALVRWQDGLITLLALFELVAAWWRDGQQGAPRSLRTMLASTRAWLPIGLLFAAGVLIAFSPQMIAWQILYGSPLTAPQGQTFFYFNRPEIWNVLFGLKRGLFTWTPLVLLGVLGLIPLYRRYKLLCAAVIVIFALETYLNSIVYDWWGGEAFGARRFIGLLPFLALGLAALVDVVRAHASRWAVLALLAAFVVWNNLFILQYDLWLHGIGHISADPTLSEITIDKFTLPFKLLLKIK
ncbi:MAG: glycosyltransferase family 39 protein [Anaerolineae bacterium]